MKKILPSLLLIILFTLTNKSNASTLSSGSWKFILKTTHADVPVIIDLDFRSKNPRGTILNGKEKISLQDIKVNSKEVIIPLQSYEISMELNILNSKKLEGKWIRHNKNPKIILPVIAEFGEKDRFKIPTSNFENISGKWEVKIEDESGRDSRGILILEQNGALLNGSLLTETGDFRFMEGFIKDKSFELASFDGMFNYIFKGEVSKSQIKAQLLSTYKLTLTGKKNEKATLSDPYSLTQFVGELNFQFPDLKGEIISLEKYKNQPVIIQFFGSWCPNCIDEMNYLIPWYKTQAERKVEIIALAFERSLDSKLAKTQLLKVQKKFQVPYPLLFAGATSADKPEELIKGLKNFISFPTMIFLNKDHQIKKIHAGFSGPSTGEFFNQWKKEFLENVELISK